jgi:hypothetical protein
MKRRFPQLRGVRVYQDYKHMYCMLVLTLRSAVQQTTVITSVSDPHWFHFGSGCGYGSRILGQFGSGSGSDVLITKTGKKLTADKNLYFLMKIGI